MEGRVEQQQQKPPVGDRWEDIQGAHSWDGLLDPFDPILKSEILRYGDFACACYSGTKNDRILCEKLLLKESDNLQECGYKITQYIYANVRSATSYILGKKGLRTVQMGFIAVCTDANEISRLGRRDIVVAFKGTSKPRDWFQNLKFQVVCLGDLPGTNSYPDIMIHQGFRDFYKDTNESGSERSAKDIITSEIARLLEEYEEQSLSITVTGHSLGAALATISAYYIKQQQPSIPVTVFSFASPRVGNQAFANHVQAIGVNVLRVVVKTDRVPKVPGLILNEKKKKLGAFFGKHKLLRKVEYCHVGIEFRLDPHHLSWWDRHIHGHNLNICLYLIDGYQGSSRPFKSSQRGEMYLARAKREDVPTSSS